MILMKGRTKKKTCPSAILSTPQIAHRLPWQWTWDSTVKGQWLTACSMAWLELNLLCLEKHTQILHTPFSCLSSLSHVPIKCCCCSLQHIHCLCPFLSNSKKKENNNNVHYQGELFRTHTCHQQITDRRILIMKAIMYTLFLNCTSIA